MRTKRRDAGVLRGGDEFRVPCAMTRSKSAREPLMIATRWTTRVDALARGAQRGRVGDVAGGELDAPRGEARRARRVAHERAHVLVPRAQRVHDMRPDEARCRR